MYRTNALASLLVVAFLICCSTTLQTSANSEQDNQRDIKITAPEVIQLDPLITGLSNPLYVTHAHDGTNRLFIVEQAGRIQVVQPGASTSTVFLDIVSRVLSGGERG